MTRGALRTYDEFKPHRKPVEIAADCVRKGDKLAVEAGNCIVRLEKQIATALNEHAKLREALQNCLHAFAALKTLADETNGFLDGDHLEPTGEGFLTMVIHDAKAALEVKGAERE
jgi:hypothetical protein